MTSYFREVDAGAGDTFEISRENGESRYVIRVIQIPAEPIDPNEEPVYRIRITSGWRRIH
jgi:hypothetical protein